MSRNCETGNAQWKMWCRLRRSAAWNPAVLSTPHSHNNIPDGTMPDGLARWNSCFYPISHTHKASSQVLCWTCCISCPQLPKRQLACCMPGGQGFSNTTTIQVPGRRGSSTSAPRRCRRYRTRGLSRMPLGKDTTGFRRLFSAYKVKLCSSIVKPPDGNSQEALTTTGNQVNRHGITTRRTPGGSKDG